jgi:hypothetical protein
MANLPYQLDIDFTLLRRQKMALVDVSMMSEKPGESELLDGIIHILDQIQLQAVEVHDYDEEDVYLTTF